MLRRQWTRARLVYSAGLAAYLVHVWCAFEFVYAWSHAVAYRETARQTLELFGVDWGGGLYLNYLFTILWCIDCAMWWARADRWKVRPFVQAFLVFMVVNGTVVVWVLRAMR